MKRSLCSLSSIIIISVLSACTSMNSSRTDSSDIICVSPQGNVVTCSPNTLQSSGQNSNLSNNLPKGITQYSSLQPSSHLLLKEYIEQLASETMVNAKITAPNATIGATGFVDLSPNLNTSNLLGVVLTEYFVSELHKSGGNVVDYKLSGKVQVGNDIDYVFTRDSIHSTSQIPMTHVLTGTMLYQKSGLMLSVRVVGFKDKRVIATGQKFIPYFLVEDIVLSIDQG